MVDLAMMVELQTAKGSEEHLLERLKESQKMYSIGHSNHNIDYFIKLLLDNGVNKLVDVRGSPTSWRNKQFNKPLLKAICIRKGIQYVHCDQLGNTVTPIGILLESEGGRSESR